MDDGGAWRGPARAAASVAGLRADLVDAAHSTDDLAARLTRAYASDPGALERVAAVLEAVGCERAVVRVLEHVLGAREFAHGLESPEVARALLGLASVYERVGDAAKRAAALDRALAVLERNDADEGTLADVLGRLADAHADLGDAGRARDLFARALLLEERVHGAESLFAGREKGGLQSIDLHLERAIRNASTKGTSERP